MVTLKFEYTLENDRIESLGVMIKYLLAQNLDSVLEPEQDPLFFHSNVLVLDLDWLPALEHRE